MIIPKDKLPLKRSQFNGSYGSYSITYRKKEEEKIDDFLTTTSEIEKYCGRIHGKELAEYVVTAANKFPKALELLQKIQDIIELDGDEFTDGECIDMIYALNIKKFLENG